MIDFGLNKLRRFSCLIVSKFTLGSLSINAPIGSVSRRILFNVSKVNFSMNLNYYSRTRTFKMGGDYRETYIIHTREIYINVFYIF